MECLARQVCDASRVGDPAEFASLVAHNADKGMVNGEVFPLDGAFHIGLR